MSESDNATPVQTSEDLQKKVSDLEASLRQKDQVLAAYADALGKFRQLVTSQAQENFQRSQEIIEVAEMRVAKAQPSK